MDGFGDERSQEEWDEPAGDDLEDRPWSDESNASEELAAPAWSQDLREAGLVVLQAAVLSRRVFLPATRPEDLSPEQWQILLAVALVESSEHGRPATSLGSLARLLTLSPEDARDGLAALIDSGHVSASTDVPVEDRGGRLRWTPTARGWAAAQGYLERAGRFLPGWPPR